MFPLNKKNVGKKRFFLSIIIFTSILTKYFSKYTQSLDPGYSEISENLKKTLDSSYPLNEESIPSPEIININTDTISADQDHSINLKLPYKSGDLGTDIMELLYVKKSGKIFSIKNYNVTYFLNEKNVIHTIYPNMFPDDVEDTVQNDVDCKYTVLDNEYKLEYHANNNSFSKIIFYSYVTLFLDMKINSIKRIEYNSKNIYIRDIINNIINGKEFFVGNNGAINSIIFLDIFKIEQMFFNKIYFVFLIKYKNIINNDNDWNFLLLFYEIKLLVIEDFSLSLESVININNILNNNEIANINIEKIGYYKNYKFILFSKNIEESNNSLIIFDSSKNKIIPLEEIFNDYSSINQINIKDFLIYNETFCILEENKGLIIFNIKQDLNNEEKIIICFNNILEFNFGKKLEIYRNPFYGGIYLGILFYNNKENKGNEIYMEILLEEKDNNETIAIKINKLLTASNKRNFLHTQIKYDFFKYFYDDANKDLFLYRNGLINIVPYVSYKIKLIDEKNLEILKKENISEMIPIYNKKEEVFNLVLIGNKYYIILKNLTLASHNLNCTFHDVGSYNLTFILKGEVCANSLLKSQEGNYITCHKIIKYNFHVYNRGQEKKILIFIIILFVIICLASILFLCYSINTKCFGKYKNNKFKKFLFSPNKNDINVKRYSNNKQKDN